MAARSVFKPHPLEFDRFLYASVGEDRNGYAVTVLSMLARLGLDPWKETAELFGSGRGPARSRLGALLSQFRDVPALETDHDKVAQDLSLLLPKAPTSVTLKRAASTVADGGLDPSIPTWAVLMIILVLLQMVVVGGSGSVE